MNLQSEARVIVAWMSDVLVDYMQELPDDDNRILMAKAVTLSCLAV